jgi:hypothetical protein
VVQQTLRQHQPGQLVIDVGAYDGQEAIQYARAGHKVLSFEPTPSKAIKIKQALADAGVEDSVDFYSYAISDKSGMDQTLLIHHFYSGQMAQANLSTVLNGRGIGPAYSLRYALVDPLWYSRIVRYAPPGEQIRFPHLLPFTIHNDDNSSTAVCHQYDVDWRLKALMYGAALCYHAQHYASNASNRTHHNQYCEQRGLTVANATQLTRRICNNVSSVCRDVVTSA